MSTGKPAPGSGYRPPDLTDEQHLALGVALLPLAERLAIDLSRAHGISHDLARMAAMRHISRLAGWMSENAARMAGTAGASYADLGAVWGIGPDEAWAKWPGAVPRPVDPGRAE